MSIPTVKTIEELLSLLYKNRGLINQAEIEAFLKPPKPEDISLKELGIDKKAVEYAIDRIIKARADQEKVVIYGDYDADGICATAVLWHGLASIGIPSIPFIPNREVHGYGISKIGIDEIIEKYNPTLVITVDNGIVAHEAAEYLADKEIDLIITDHHQTDEKEPEALSIVHTDKVCGTTVAWILVRELLRQFDVSKHRTISNKLLDLVAIGTIADMMPMVGLNRSFAVYGLEALSKTTRPGLKAMKEEAGIEPGTSLSSYHVGFILGPRINAMGRIDQGIDALRLLCTKDSTKANDLALHLANINRDRQSITAEAVDLAVSLYESNVDFQKQRIIVLGHEDFHEGIIGLVAGKLAEKYYKPTIVLSVGEVKTKGSARSVSGVNIIKLIREVEDLLLGAGGHPGAAGLSVDTSKIDAFQKAIEAKALEYINEEDLIKTTKVEVGIPLSLVSLDLYDQLELLSPFGVGNQRPIFESEVEVVDHRIIGKQGTHLKMTVTSKSGGFVDAIGFGMAEKAEILESSNKITMAYSVDKNEWNGSVKVQLLVKSL